VQKKKNLARADLPFNIPKFGFSFALATDMNGTTGCLPRMLPGGR
jgi:hypothetical protein